MSSILSLSHALNKYHSMTDSTNTKSFQSLKRTIENNFAIYQTRTVTPNHSPGSGATRLKLQTSGYQPNDCNGKTLYYPKLPLISWSSAHVLAAIYISNT